MVDAEDSAGGGSGPRAEDSAGGGSGPRAEDSAGGGSGPRAEKDTGPVPGAPWPPSFPHAEIDGLLRRLSDEVGAGDVEDVERLLLLVVREAQRLRSAVVRLSTARLSAAEQEASQVLAEAYAHADDVRSRALSVLDDRLDEADQIVRAMRRAFLAEHGIRGATSGRPRDPDEPSGAVS